MSKGTRRITTRVDPDIMAEVMLAISERNANSTETPWTLSDWTRIAFVEKLDKIRRGRKQKGGVRRPPPRKEN
jgi:hypothetical protein